MRRLLLLFAGAVLLMAGSATAQPAITRRDRAYLPSTAIKCEQSSSSSKCRRCNREATVGALDRVTIQVGGCASSVIQVASLNSTDVVLGTAAQTVTIPGNLLVTGTSVHSGLETFLGNIATAQIFPVPLSSSVNVPGARDGSLQIGNAGEPQTM